MRIHDPNTEAEEPYNLVPLTDMVFNLLIFFMCATTFVQIEKDLKVQLPRATSAFTPISAPPKQIVINIREDGTLTMEGKTIDLAAIAPRIAAAVKTNPDQAVIIRADAQSRMRSFADVTRICKQAGIKEARIVYLDESGKGGASPQ